MIHFISGITVPLIWILSSAGPLESIWSPHIAFSLVNSSQLSKLLQMLLDDLTLCSWDQKGVRHQCLNPKVVPKSNTSKNFAQGNSLKLPIDSRFFATVEIYYSLKCNNGLQINYMPDFKKSWKGSVNNTTKDRVINLLNLPRTEKVLGMQDIPS